MERERDRNREKRGDQSNGEEENEMKVWVLKGLCFLGSTEKGNQHAKGKRGKVRETVNHTPCLWSRDLERNRQSERERERKQRNQTDTKHRTQADLKIYL